LKLGKIVLLVGLVGLVWALMGGPLAARAAQKTPTGLLDEARTLYQAHNYEGAMKRLQQIDRAALGFFDKGKYDALLQDTQKAVTHKAADEKAFAEGKEALSKKHYAEAVAKLSQAANSRYIEADKAGPAMGLLRLARDAHDKALQQARDLMDQAAADIKAGNTDAARKKVEQIEAMHIRLAGADRAGLADLKQGLAVAKAEPAPQTKPAEKKPAEKKPAEKKPAEKKPAETKPAEKKPVETKPAEKKPAETKPAEKKPVEKKPAAEKAPAPEKPEPEKPVGPTAGEQYAKAKQLYKAGDYQAAKKQLADVNPDALGFFQRWGYAGFVEDVDRAITGRAAGRKALSRGKQALDDDQYATAVRSLSEAASCDYLDEKAHQEAVDALREAKQAHEKALAKAKDLIRKGNAALDEDKAPLAKEIVDYIAGMDVDLGWWTGMRFDRLRERVASMPASALVRTATPAAAEPVKKPAPPEKKLAKPVKKPAEPEKKPAEPAKPEKKPAPEKAVEADIVAQARRAHAEEQIKLGQEALKGHEYQKAKTHFARALNLWADSEQAKQGLQEAEKLLAEREEPLSHVVRDLDNLERQRIIANVEGLLDDADRQMQAAERPEGFVEALRPLAKATRIVDVAAVLSIQEQERLRERIHAIRKQIKERQTAAEDERAAQAAIEAERREAARREADRRDREQKIAQLWQRASELRKSMQFGESVEVLDRLLAVDPMDERARRWREDLLYLQSQERQVGIRNRRDAGTVDVLVDVEDAATPIGEKLRGETRYLRYPEAKKWKDLSEFRRAFTQAVSAEPKAVAETRRRLDERIDLDFEKTSLDNVLNYISEVQHGLNIVIDPDISTAGIELSTRLVDLKVKQVSVDSVLQLILGTDLGYRVEPGYILVTTREKLQQNLPVVTYPVQDLVAQIPDFGGEAPRFEVGDVTQAAAQAAGGGGGAFGDLFGAGAGAGLEEGPAGPQELRDLIQRTVNNQSDPSVAAWADEGGPAAIEYMNGLLIVTQTRIGHTKVADLLEQLRRERAIMISVESRFCQVTDDFLQDITLDVDVAFLGSERFDAAGAPIQDPGNPAIPPYDTLPGVPADPAGGDYLVPTGQPIVISGTGSNGLGTSALLPLAQTVFNNFTSPNEGGLSVGGVFLDDIQVGFLLRAIQADYRQTTLQAPRITLYNGQRSYISVSTVDTYIADVEPVVAEDAVGWDPTIGAIPVGVTLDVKATVSADRRYVQMDLRPQYADISGWDREVIQAAVPLGGIAEAPINLPEVIVQDFKTTVSVPDGGTLLLGGTREFIEAEAETGVPILSKVPILKRIFNNRATVRAADNLLILVRPQIIIQAEEEARLGYDNF